MTGTHRTVQAALAGLAVALAGAAAQASPEVVVTIKPVHSLVAQVMDGVGTPRLLLDGTASPHAYSMRPSDVRAVQSALLLVRVSADLESFLGHMLTDAVPGRSVLTFDTLPGVEVLRWSGAHDHEDHDDHDDHDDKAASHEDHGKHDDKAASHEDHGKHDDHDDKAASHDDHGKHDDHDGHDDHVHGDHDTHLWLDPRNAVVLVRAVAADLARIDPGNAARYRANADRSIAGLEALEARTRQRLEPVHARAFVVFHAAYGYFERRFDLRPSTAVTLNPETPPGARRLSEIRTTITERGATCIFAEPQFRPAVLQTVAEGTGARIGTLDPLGAALPAGPAAYGLLIDGLATGLLDCLAS